MSAAGTIAAARIIPENGLPFYAISLYARWEMPHPDTPTVWGVGYADAMAHRAISDLSAPPDPKAGAPAPTLPRNVLVPLSPVLVVKTPGLSRGLAGTGARVEVARFLTGHPDPETTKLHDRRADRVSLDGIERTGI